MAAKARILAIDDQLYFRSFIQGLLSDEGYQVQTADGQSAALDLMAKQGAFDIVILHFSEAGSEEARAVKRLRERWPEQPVIVVSSTGDARSAVSMMQSGAADYLVKPVERDPLLASIDRVLRQGRERAEHAGLVDENLELMSRISLFERSLALLGPSRLGDVTRGLLQLLCAESRTRDGALWLRRESGGALQLAATHGEVTWADEPQVWSGEPETFDEALHAGHPVRDRSQGGPPERLFVPCIREGRLLAIARLSRCSSGALSAREAEVCVKLGAIGGLGLANALARESLEGQGFRDPRTELPTRGFFEEVLEVELLKAQRYGRRVTVLCVEIEGLDAERDAAALPDIVEAVKRSVRNMDVLACEGAARYWVLMTESDPLGGVVLKRRIAQRMDEVLSSSGLEAHAFYGVATYPLDGETRTELMKDALGRVAWCRQSLVRELGIQADTPLAEIGWLLLQRAQKVPAAMVGSAAEVVIGELSSRPRDNGVLFLAPGPDRRPFMVPLTALGDIETATDVFLATDGDTHPQGPVMTALALPQNVSPDTTWIVRFGEAPPYALVAGPMGGDGARDVFHTSDPDLVEHMAFRLRAEVGFGLAG